MWSPNRHPIVPIHPSRESESPGGRSVDICSPVPLSGDESCSVTIGLYTTDYLSGAIQFDSSSEPIVSSSVRNLTSSGSLSERASMHRRSLLFHRSWVVRLSVVIDTFSYPRAIGTGVYGLVIRLEGFATVIRDERATLITGLHGCSLALESHRTTKRKEAAHCIQGGLHIVRQRLVNTRPVSCTGFCNHLCPNILTPGDCTTVDRLFLFHATI